MSPSKIVVLLLGFVILAGVVTWTWVNFAHSPEHDPEVAHRYVQHFHRLCRAEIDNEEVCARTIGDHHRTCFEEHLRPTPPDQIEELGPVLYDRPSYMSCMRSGVESLLNEDSP